ncbi:YodC family protein [Aeromonas dhakensis]|uniref:YodC family protein n=1 Tax=Aeromonas dhakensis TaxID=196024 RepID=UPI0023790CEA|nr:DUF2158 domain-containing protein [Aeromonas dhakensis]MDD9210807.1 DUF2158 domain-containing protein [Aeromonas dhakensis]
MNVGDEVQLKSGGPVMTIVALRDGGVVECGWFDGGSYKTDLFPQVALVPYE